MKGKQTILWKRQKKKKIEGRQPTCTLRTPVTSAEPPDSENVTDHCDRHRPFLHIHNSDCSWKKQKKKKKLMQNCIIHFISATPTHTVPPLWSFQELTAHLHPDLYLTNTPGSHFTSVRYQMPSWIAQHILPWGKRYNCTLDFVVRLRCNVAGCLDLDSWQKTIRFQNIGLDWKSQTY